MLGNLSGVAKFYLVTGHTSMRKSIDGLMTIIRDTYEMEPYSNSLFLFVGDAVTGSRHCILKKMDSAFCIKDWITAVSSVQGIPPK